MLDFLKNPHQNHDKEISVDYSFWPWVTVFINVAIGSPLTAAEWDIRQGLGSGDRTRSHIIFEITTVTWKANTNMKSSHQIFCHQIFCSVSAATKHTIQILPPNLVTNAEFDSKTELRSQYTFYQLSFSGEMAPTETQGHSCYLWK